MKTKGLAWIVAAAVALSLASVAAAQDEKSWSVSGGVDYTSLYIFRGVNLLGDDQEVLTPHVNLAVGNFNFYYYGYRGNFDTETGDDSYTEDDFGGDYTFALGDKISLTVGAVTYQYSGTVENGLGFADTYELYGILALDVFLSPTFSFYRDMDAVKGGYGSLAISHSFPLGEKVSLDFSAALGIDNKYNSGKTQLNDFLVGLNVPITFNDHFDAHVMVQRSIALDALDDIGQPDETVYGVGLGFSF
ncbi:MAG: TorF family putative porin [Thermoanaerobaculia bacterium]